MDIAVEMRDLSVVFPSRQGDVTALDRVSLAVASGKVCGFLGPNGAGKTTAMHVLLGFVEPTAGEARILGTDTRQPIARQRIGYLPEHPHTYTFLSARELLTMTGRLFLIEKQMLRERVQTLLQRMGLEKAADRRIGTYSRGMLQRVCLAQALINDPDLVILDEPTNGLDPIARMDVRRLIGELRDRGKTVFFSSHELSEVELVCDHITILAAGRVKAQGAASDLVAKDESLERFFMNLVQESTAQ